MHALVIIDRDQHGPLAQGLRDGVCSSLAARGHEVDLVPLGAADISPCTGCLRCHFKTLGTCVDEDGLSPVNARIGDLELVCVLGPSVFGQLGSTMKNVMDKLQTNRMRSRFTIVIGYGDDVRNDEAETFLDIVRKHGGAANVVHKQFMARNEVYLSRSQADTAAICDQLRRTV